MAKKALRERINDADFWCQKWLGDGNEYAERGNHEKAERCYEKSQFWLDRLNTLEGND
ncbi:MAG: hypothetical protein ABJJ37_05690 [Roseibium sp.]